MYVSERKNTLKSTSHKSLGEAVANFDSTMRLCIRKALRAYPKRTRQACLLCDRIQFLSSVQRHFHTVSQVRAYSNDANIPNSVESTGTLPDDLSTTATKVSEVDKHPSSAASTHNGEPHIRAARKPWTFRALPAKRIDSATRARELTAAISKTSLRRKLHWFPPQQGVNPAYDMALFFLNHDRQKKITEIQRLEKRIDHERKSNLPLLSS